jgi:isatin hydrolase
LLDRDTIIGWERQYGRIPAGSWVLMRTDWCKRTQSEEFLNVDEHGAHSPGFHWEATKFLLEQRNILGIGVETVGIDAGQADRFDPSFPNHAMVLGAGKFGLASLHNLSELSPVGTVLVAAPLKIVGGSGSPARVLGLIEK